VRKTAYCRLMLSPGEFKLEGDSRLVIQVAPGRNVNAEAEHMAGAWGVKEALWLRKMMTTLSGKGREEKASLYIATIKARALCCATLQGPSTRGPSTSMWHIT
jgi:hypothetical protein